MSGGWFVCGVALLVGLSACKPREAAARSRDELVLELGGDGPPLAKLLTDARRRVESASSQTIASPLRLRAPERPVRYRTVRLGAGESLSKLCARVLGDSSRWREIAELNGWSEADLRRLAEGTDVRLPMQ
ncbi:MAG: hypothetical protein U1F36_11815 [Planctomycetota bacterium]